MKVISSRAATISLVGQAISPVIADFIGALCGALFNLKRSAGNSAKDH
jgi:hypothetical protein